MQTNELPKGFEQLFFSDGYRLGQNHPVRNDVTNLERGARELYHNADQLIDAFVQRCQAEGVPVDCRMGCSWCCHQAVFATTPEMMVLVKYLKKRFSPEVVADVLEKAKAKEEKFSTLSPAETPQGRHACPLLRKGSCMVYSLRPMACRIYLSSNVQSCIAKHHKPDDPKARPALFDFPLKAGRQLNEGFTSALREQGYSVEEHRIEHILLRLLTHPKTEKEWLTGISLHEGFPFDELPDQPGNE